MNELIDESHPKSNENKNDLFKNHDLFDILDGHP